MSVFWELVLQTSICTSISKSSIGLLNSLPIATIHFCSSLLLLPASVLQACRGKLPLCLPRKIMPWPQQSPGHRHDPVVFVPFPTPSHCNTYTSQGLIQVAQRTCIHPVSLSDLGRGALLCWSATYSHECIMSKRCSMPQWSPPKCSQPFTDTPTLHIVAEELQHMCCHPRVLAAILGVQIS